MKKTHRELGSEALDEADRLLNESIGGGSTEAVMVARAQVEATMALAYAVVDMHATIVGLAFDVGAVARDR